MSSSTYPPLNPLEPNNINNFVTNVIRQKYKDLEFRMCQQFGWDRAKRFQVDGALLQLARCDGMIHVGTGQGKTAVAAAPYVLQENSQKSTIFVSPLIVLQSEMEAAFRQKYSVSAIAVNSLLGPRLTQVIKDILAKKYRIILISPETLLSHRIRDELLTNIEFKKLILSIVIDEVHVIAYWGQTFRKKYGSLHIVRDHLPGVPLIGLSATLTPRTLNHIASNLSMKIGMYAFINEGNERPEIALAVRKCEYPLASFQDFRFLFKGRIFHPLDVPKTFVFIDNKADGHRAVRAINSFLPPNLASLGIVRPFNARHSPQYRINATERFKIGDIRILICTDAAGMGCDISDVDIVVQWRVTPLPSLIQRWGRLARGPGRTGLAVLLLEPAAYTFNPTEPGSKTVSEFPQTKLGSKKKQLKESLKKGGWKSTNIGAQPEIRQDSPYEGTLVLGQTNGCLRKIWTEIFKNQPVAPVGDCCTSQVCSPALLARIKVPKSTGVISSRSRKTRRKGVPHLPTEERLTEWRMQMWLQDHSDSTWGPSGLLSDSLIGFISSVGSIPDYEALKQLLAERWGWWHIYSNELAELVCHLDIPYLPIPSKPRQSKRKAAEIDSETAASDSTSALQLARPRARKPVTTSTSPVASSSRAYILPTARSCAPVRVGGPPIATSIPTASSNRIPPRLHTGMWNPPIYPHTAASLGPPLRVHQAHGMFFAPPLPNNYTPMLGSLTPNHVTTPLLPQNLVPRSDAPVQSALHPPKNPPNSQFPLNYPSV